MLLSDGNAPTCPRCQVPARLTDGREIYPHLSDLAARSFFKCDGCGAYVGCHAGTTRALGTPAGPKLRDARIKLHNQMIDPLWMRADECGLYQPDSDHARWLIRRAARGRVYAFLADRMGLTREQTHVSLFTIEQCRDAWRALRGVAYPQIRAWAHAQPKPARKRKAKHPSPVEQEGVAA